MLAELKRILHPLRPVLLPIWRTIRPYVEPRRDGRPLRIRVVGKTRASGIRPLRPRELKSLERQAPYYKGRSEYMSAACRIAGELIDRRGLTSALELGPHLRPVIVGSDVMDVRDKPALEREGAVLLFDATETPWPVEDGRYDLFVGLQVFEHLRGKQAQAFREVRRVARHAIISLPIDWTMDDPTNCHHQISHEKALSWFAPVEPTRVEIGNGGQHKRLIYVFEGLGD